MLIIHHELILLGKQLEGPDGGEEGASLNIYVLLLPSGGTPPLYLTPAAKLRPLSGVIGRNISELLDGWNRRKTSHYTLGRTHNRN